ncbi:hypothetical protein Trydic_g14422, partial [Trypoxylus dichotomus]
MPTLHVNGEGFLADLLRSIVRAFQPVGVRLEIDTIPCLPDPIPPDYDRYVQIASLLVICWVLTLFEPYGLRWRHSVMCYYHPSRAKERAIWLYNQVIRTRSSFLKFARRQLRRKFTKDSSIAKITCKEYLAANLTARCKIFRLCIEPGKQTACLLCGEVFREDDPVRPIKCQTPGCPGVYCEHCFEDLQNLCTICLDPIQYGDLSDISEEKDSSEEEASQLSSVKRKKKKCRWCKKICGKDESDGSDTDLSSKDQTGDAPNSATDASTKRETDSDYYSTEAEESDSFEYQYRKDITQPGVEYSKRAFTDLEKQRVRDYASMGTFKKDEPKVVRIQEPSEAQPEHKLPTEPQKGEEKKKVKVQKSTDKKQRRCCTKPSKGKSKRQKKNVDEIPLLYLQTTSSTEEEDSSTKDIPSSTTSYIESEISKKVKRRGKRKIRGLKKKSLESSSTETTYIETPPSKSKRSYPSDFNSISTPRDVPEKKQRISHQVPKDVPKLDLNFDTGDCPPHDHSSVCKIFDRKVKYREEVETSSGNRSARSATFLSTTMSEPLETSPSSETTTVSTSVRSSQVNKSSPHEPINYLYDAATRPPDIDQNETVIPAKPLVKPCSGTAVSDVPTEKTFKRKVHDYYKRTSCESIDKSKVKEDKPQSKFGKFLSRVLRK